MRTNAPAFWANLRWLAPLIICLAAHAQSWDVIIRNGTIIDGTGRPGFLGDVALKDGRIASVGHVEGTARQQLDVTGCVVAPGFIDVHTHAEGVLARPDAENFIRMGVTTVIVGNCGASVLNVSDFFRSLEQTKVSLNVATLIGHNAVRTAVMGNTSMETPSDEELARMKLVVERAMKEGAVGFSTGLIYTPGKYSRTEEIIELARVAGAYQGIYATHVRNEQEGLVASLEEAFKVGASAKIPVEISHLKLSGDLTSPQGKETIRRLEQARANGLAGKVIDALASARKEGIKVSQDLYAYSAAAASLERLLPQTARGEEAVKLSERLNDESERKRIATEMKQDLLSAGRTDYSHVMFVSARRYKAIEGLTLPDATQKRRGTNSLDAQIDLILEIVRNGGASIIVYEMNEQDLLPFLRLPDTMFASDSGTFQSESEMRHPRGYGNAARVLARYVLQEKELPLEEAIRRMTLLGASTFHLKDRGEIRKGAWADVVVFDPATVQERAKFASPHVYATGFKHVFVNGVETVSNDQYTGARAGQPLRRGE